MALNRRINERRLAEAREEGHEEGLEKDRAEGREEGRAEERQRLREWYANLPQEFKDRLPPPF